MSRSQRRSTTSASISPTRKALVAFLKAMEFTTIMRRAAEIYGVDANAIEPDPALVGPGGWRGRNGERIEQAARDRPRRSPRQLVEAATPARPADAVRSPRPRRSPPPAPPRPSRKRSTAADIATIATLEELDAMDRGGPRGRRRRDRYGDVLARSDDRPNSSAFRSARAPGRAAYIPLAHRGDGDAGELFGGGDLLPGQLPVRDVLDRLKPLLEAPDVLKIAQNMKFDWLVFAQHGIEVAPFDDTMLISYVLDAGVNGHGMDELVSRSISATSTIQFGEVAGSGKSFIGFARVADRQGDRIFGRGCRCDAAPVARA